MCDAQSTFRRAIPEQRPRLSHERYLQACRARGAVNQEQRAHLLGMPRQSVSRYELGKVEPRVSTASWIASRLGLTVEDLWPAA